MLRRKSEYISYSHVIFEGPQLISCFTSTMYIMNLWNNKITAKFDNGRITSRSVTMRLETVMCSKGDKQWEIP